MFKKATLLYKNTSYVYNNTGEIMKHEIDLSKYNMRTDLVTDVISEGLSGVVSEKREEGDIVITEVKVDEEGSMKIGKKKGNYITIEFNDVTDYNNKEKLKKIFSKYLKKMLKETKIKEKDSCLVIGLGNKNSTPDALGPNSIDNILVTSHLFEIGELDSGFRKVSAIAPGVMGQTGIETSEVILSLVKSVKPDFLLVIDALASQSLERVNKTIQMTDTGIHPGSGIGNSRKEISYEVTGIPVIAIGIPTVVDAITIVSDTINYMHKHYSYSKQNINNPMNKLIFNNQPNYLKKDITVLEDDKKMLLGIVGTLNENEIKQLLFEVLTPIGYNLMVTPKEVDFLVERLSDVIGYGINEALHKNVNL